MVRRNVVLPDELDRDFRKAVAERKGVGKGNLSEAIVEGIRLWLAQSGHVAEGKELKKAKR